MPRRAVAAGEVSEVVQLWQPWWLSEEAAQLELSDTGTALVAEVAEVTGKHQLFCLKSMKHFFKVLDDQRRCPQSYGSLASAAGPGHCNADPHSPSRSSA